MRLSPKVGKNDGLDQEAAVAETQLEQLERIVKS